MRKDSCDPSLMTARPCCLARPYLHLLSRRCGTFCRSSQFPLKLCLRFCFDGPPSLLTMLNHPPCQMVVFYTVYNACLLAWSYWLYGKTMTTSLQVCKQHQFV